MKIICIGRNYAEHIVELDGNRNRPAEPAGYSVPPDRVESRERRRPEGHRCPHEGLRLHAPRLSPSRGRGDAAVQ